jgi:hypothetical protein
LLKSEAENTADWAIFAYRIVIICFFPVARIICVPKAVLKVLNGSLFPSVIHSLMERLQRLTKCRF